MKELSPKTIKAYDSKRLAKHLDRLMSKFNVAPYRVDLSYGTIYQFKEGSGFWRYCSINEYNRHHIIEAIEDSWIDLKKGANND